MADQNRIHKLLQFIALIAAEQDDFTDRSLGPIHLIKYVYLADLAYAATHHGKTYTGAKWQFYHFGPMANEVYCSIEGALQHINVKCQSLPSDYGKEDWKRYMADEDDVVLKKLDDSLPFAITANVRRSVRQFSNDTPGLLEHVYRTQPMLKARPNMYLDFSSTVLPTTEEDDYVPLMARLTAKKRKKMVEYARDLAARRKDSPPRARKRSATAPPEISLSLDEFERGIEWLDSLAGESIKPGQFDANFDDSVWEQSVRNG